MFLEGKDVQIEVVGLDLKLSETKLTVYGENTLELSIHYDTDNSKLIQPGAKFKIKIKPGERVIYATIKKLIYDFPLDGVVKQVITFSTFEPIRILELIEGE